MTELPTSVDIVVIGAGAAGLGAGRRLKKLGASFCILEAAHRVGGRAYTEDLAPGVPFDLGCHWMHSARHNPFVGFADDAGFSYRKGTYEGNLRFTDDWEHSKDAAACDDYYDRNFEALEAIHAAEHDLSVADAVERDTPWVAAFDYWISLSTSHDPDQVSATDVCNYLDTDEDWAVKEGYGNLVARQAAGLPIQLNAVVTEVDSSQAGIRITTSKGTLSAKTVIITVSTGILGAGDIRFTPELPDWKRQAVADLPLGCHNRICLAFDRNVFGEDHPLDVTLLSGESEPMAFHISPFGYNYVSAVTGGRFADWLERAGSEASVDLAKENLQKAFGSSITKHLVRHLVTAWRGDPWVRGAYSAAAPGAADQRARLAEAIDGRLYFAGEATSQEFYATAHGAYLSGQKAAEQAYRSVSSSP